MRLTNSFTVKEFQCRCGCLHCEMSPLYMAPTSGYRCAKHNRKQSSTGATGPHTQGLASDWQYSGSDAYKLVAIAIDCGIKKIGLNQKGPHQKRFIHLADDAPPSGHDVWIYTY